MSDKWGDRVINNQKQYLNPEIEVQMLIRKSSNIVFTAFIDPNITTKFWFNHASGRVEQGKSVLWTWTKYNVSSQIHVLKVIENELIQIQWGEEKTKVDFIFEKTDKNFTYLKIRNSEISLEGQALIDYIVDTTGGFTTVVDAAKAWLEYGIQLNLVNDKFMPFE